MIEKNFSSDQLAKNDENIFSFRSPATIRFSFIARLVCQFCTIILRSMPETYLKLKHKLSFCDVLAIRIRSLKRFKSFMFKKKLKHVFEGFMMGSASLPERERVRCHR